LPHLYDPNQARVSAGRHGGGQWTREGGGPDAIVRPAFFRDRRSQQAAKAWEALLALFAWLSARNTPDQRAIIKAHEFRTDDAGAIQLDSVKVLTRDEVEQYCKKLDRVQELTDAADKEVRSEKPNLTPSQHGTEVHLRIKKEVNGPNDNEPLDPNFRAEVSRVKSDEVRYGKEGSVRIDVLENVKDGPVCVYDIKTGQSGLSFRRIREIRRNVVRAYGKTHFIVTEIRPMPTRTK